MSRFTRVNGSIGVVVVFLVWVYTQAVILLYGVEFTAAYARLRRGRPEDSAGRASAARLKISTAEPRDAAMHECTDDLAFSGRCVRYD